MQVRIFAIATVVWAASAWAEDKPTPVVNLASATIVGMRLSHAGSGVYGDDLVIGRTSGVRHGQRLDISDIPAGHYDVELKFDGGRVCFVRDVKFVVGQELSIEDNALKVCSKK